MRLYYDGAVRARLAACPSLLEPTKPTTEPAYGPEPRFVSLNEQRQLERLDGHVKFAEQVTEANPHTDRDGNPIPVGYYAITDSDGSVYGSEPSFFESVWFPYEETFQ